LVENLKAIACLDLASSTKIATTKQILFATNNEERLCSMQRQPAGEIGKTPIHDVKTACFGCQNAEQHIHLDRRPGLTKMCPRKKAQIQADGFVSSAYAARFNSSAKLSFKY
jgi:hypothetical protein